MIIVNSETLGQKLGRLLRDARTKSEMSVDALSHETGITSVQIRKIERGDSLPSSVSLFRIVRALDLGLEEVADLFVSDEESQLDEEIARLENTPALGLVGLRGTLDLNTARVEAKRNYLALLRCLPQKE